MKQVVAEFYEKRGLPPMATKLQLAKLDRHPDILEEFVAWIENGSFKQEDCVTVEDYTAESLAALSEVLDGEAAYMLLIALRENPEQAKARIAEGFKIK